MLGDRVSHYRILSRLGAGGMGVVYEAQDLTLGRIVAIKVLPPALAADHQAVLRFQREARAASALNHPHICTIHELGEHDGQPFIVMERLTGKKLSHVLRAGPLAADVLLDVAAQVADALDAAHRAGIVHRDLKPDNIFVAERGVVKLLDFGLAKLTDCQSGGDGFREPASVPTVEDPITEVGHTPGTPLYMSPEQARGEEIDGRTDLFSFGAVLYEMATGRRPFAAPDASAVKDAVRSLTPEPPSASVSGLPAGFDAVVARALEKDRALRYQTAADLLADLARLRRDVQGRRDGQGVAAGVPEVGRGAVAEGPAIRARRAGVQVMARWVWPAVAGAVVIAAAFGFWTVRRNQLPERPSTRARIQSLAVLPLENLSRDADQQYFADGMTDALITSLSRIRDLRVTSRTSSLHASKDAEGKLPDIARLLEVDAVVEGTVLRAGDRVRISAQLIDTASDRSLWASAYEGDVRDVLRLQSDVAAAVAGEIGGRLGGERMHVAVPRPVDPKAYELYLKGRYF